MNEIKIVHSLCWRITTLWTLSCFSVPALGLSPQRDKHGTSKHGRASRVAILSYTTVTKE